MSEMNHKVIEELTHLLVPISELEFWDENPRVTEIEPLAASLDEFGQYLPFLYKREGERKVIRVGNHRTRAARDVLGWSHVAVIDGTHWTDDQIEALSTFDNASAQMGGFNEQMLLDQIALVGQSDLAHLSGYTPDDVSALLDAAEEDTPAPRPDNYVRTVESPVYTPKMAEPPPLDELFDRERTAALRAEIEASDADPFVKNFLLAAAERHTKFNFDKIAEYYAHASPSVQRMMEDSALIIIDFDRALELGFVKLTQALADQFAEDRNAG